jgi:hypothetical protein
VVAAFSPEADAIVASAFGWLADFRSIQLPPIEPFVRPPYQPAKVKRRALAIVEQRRRNAFAFSPADVEALRLMAANCEHLEIGGRAMREQSDYATGGDVVGRTAWIGKPEWAEGWDMSGDEIRAAVEKAIAGDRLGHRQEALIKAMQEEIQSTRANLAPQIIAPECPF